MHASPAWPSEQCTAIKSRIYARTGSVVLTWPTRHVQSRPLSSFTMVAIKTSSRFAEKRSYLAQTHLDFHQSARIQPTRWLEMGSATSMIFINGRMAKARYVIISPHVVAVAQSVWCPQGEQVRLKNLAGDAINAKRTPQENCAKFTVVEKLPTGHSGHGPVHVELARI
ncbi:hypothetical protein LP7551_02160 [Roseibium album]|nr:hypothetical protein LP7551_02160 [Roseibium album]